MAGEFKIPQFVSSEASQLLRGILNTDPQKRFGIQDIKNSSWYRLYDSSHLKKGILVSKEKIPVISGDVEN